MAGVIANAVIMSTGAAVRLSASGLGCPSWPRCSQSDIVASHNAGQTLLNTWIEFGNRLLNFPLVLIAALVFIAAWRYGDRRLTWLAAVQPLGVVAQAVIGGIVVITKLNPAWVSIHFLLSSSIVALSVLLLARCTDFSGPGFAPAPARLEFRVQSAVLVCVTAVMFAAGTVVTGTGPLAGHADTPRYHLPLTGVTQFHADIGWLIGGLAVSLFIGLRVSGSAPAARRASAVVLCGVLLQGAIGYAQYFAHLPAGLVWVHVSMAVALLVCVLWLFFTLRAAGRAVRERSSLVSAAPRALPERGREPADR